jgi:hypothetical protein
LRVEDVLDPVHLLDARVVDSDPYRLLIGLKDPSLEFDPLALDVLVSLDVDLADDSFALLKSSLVERNPNLSFGRYEVIEEPQRSYSTNYDTIPVVPINQP